MLEKYEIPSQYRKNKNKNENEEEKSNIR